MHTTIGNKAGGGAFGGGSSGGQLIIIEYTAVFGSFITVFILE